MGRRPKETFLQRRHTNDQEAHEKMFNTANHEGNAIKTTLTYHLTQVRMTIIKKSTNKCWRGLENLVRLHTRSPLYKPSHTLL